MVSPHLDVKPTPTAATEAILTPGALAFIASLERQFRETRETLLKRREQVQSRIDAGQWPDFLPETRSIRESEWRVGPIPPDLQDRRVEITGPVDRKMVINALNSGAKVYMADFEDSHAPTWEATIQGQLNLQDAIRGTIEYQSPQGKSYRLKDRVATLVVRPRGWHLPEKHVWLDGKPVSASLFDFGLFFFHNARALLAKGTGPYFYLPKMESHLEARLWNDVFLFAQNELGIPKGTIKATILIETILAAFEMDEILYELREHIVGLNCGRWDYIFSFIKKFRNHPQFVLPDRSLVTMNQHFLKSYYELLIQTCHRRGAHAMGGMAAQIPIKEDAQANAAAIEKVRADKQREAKAGHDGTWVAHPGLVELAMQVFNEHMPSPHQQHVLRTDVRVTASDLLKVPEGAISEEGIRWNIRVGVEYLDAWLKGNGCVPLYHLMEDAATAEISRAQLWQWIRHGKLSAGVFREQLRDEVAKLGRDVSLAAKLFEELSLADPFVEFLTLRAYDYLLEKERA